MFHRQYLNRRQRFIVLIIPEKYQHARVNSHARAEINVGIQQAVKKTTVVDSIAIGSPHASERREHVS